MQLLHESLEDLIVRLDEGEKRCTRCGLKQDAAQERVDCTIEQHLLVALHVVTARLLGYLREKLQLCDRRLPQILQQLAIGQRHVVRHVFLRVLHRPVRYYVQVLQVVCQ